MSARLPWLCGLALLLGASLARAAPPRLPEAVAVVVPECRPRMQDTRRLLELLRVELRGEGVQRVELERLEGGTAPVVPVRLGLSLGCEPRVRGATLWVEATASGQRGERTMELGDVPASARPRALALGLAELLRSWWPPRAEPPPTPPPAEAAAPTPPTPAPAPACEPCEAPAPAKARPPLPPAPAARPRSERLALHVAGKALLAPGLGGPLVGWELRGEYGPWWLGSQWLLASTARSDSTEELHVIAASVGLNALRLEGSHLSLLGGAGLAGGRALLSMFFPAAGVGRTGPPTYYLEASAFLDTRLWLSESWGLSARLSAGYALPLVTQPALALGQHSWLAGLSVGVCFAP